MSAEEVLYGNQEISGRPFPTEKVVKKLAWLSPYLDSYKGYHESIDSGEDISDMLNIVFVFMGARTATLLVRPNEMVLIDRLNCVVKSLGYPEFQLEWHEVGTAAVNCICVYRRDNPRYIRRYNLTQREIGRNLDYFAAGHGGLWITPETVPTNDIGEVSAYETTHGWGIYAERVLLPYATEAEPRLLEFQRMKVSLLNSTCVELGLPYRFDFYYNTRQVEREIDFTLAQDPPPSAKWWETHRFKVLSRTPRFRSHIVLHLPFYASAYSDIRMWPLIQVMYNTFARNAPNCHLRRGYTSSLIQLFLDFENTRVDGLTLSEVVVDLKAKLKLLEERKDQFPYRSPMLPPRKQVVAKIKRLYHVESMRFQLQLASYFRRECWKVRIPSVPPFITVDAPPEADHDPLCRTFPPCIFVYFCWCILQELGLWVALLWS